MRYPRSFILSSESGTVHLIWKSHNSSFYLQHKPFKSLYIQKVIQALKHKSCGGHVELNGFCIMDNHVHMIVSYKDGSSHLSEFMRIAHGNFGRAFNKQTRRSGKVANERPKTPLLQNDEGSKFMHAMRAHFYVEANPLRARKVKTQEALRRLRHNSYAFYAYGERTEFTENLTTPEWYIRLGETAKERQEKYRELFTKYLEEFGIFKSKTPKVHPQKHYIWALSLERKAQGSKFVGELSWVDKKIQMIKQLLKPPVVLVEV